MNARLGLLLVCAMLPLDPARGALSITGGSPTWQTFPTVPLVADWSTAFVDGYNGSVNTAAQLDAAVELLSAAGVNTALAVTQTRPPSQNNFARWNATNQNVQIRTGNISFTVLMATLQNDTGVNLSSLFVSYEFGGGVFITEQIPGWRTYFSLSGTPGSWQNIPALNTTVTGSYSAVIDLGYWSAGSALYLLWADDNAFTGSDGYYTLDNFSVTDRPVLSIAHPSLHEVELSWLEAATGYRLESSDRPEGGVWGPVTEPDEPSGGQHRVRTGAIWEARFYRLVRP